MASRKKPYKAVWSHGATQLGNVSFEAASYEGIVKTVKQLARQLNLWNTVCDVMDGHRVVLSKAAKDL